MGDNMTVGEIIKLRRKELRLSQASLGKMIETNDADISRITIVNEIAPNKVNIPSGEDVKSFFVLLVSLKRKEYDEKTIATLSKLIPQNILFVLEYH